MMNAVKYLKLFLILLALSIGWQGLAWAGAEPGTGTSGSVHDMNTFAFVLNDSFMRSCIFCHTAHNAYSVAGPLWSRPLDETASGLKPYTWIAPANQQISQQLDPLYGPSRLCMSCHDGTLAIDAHGNTVTGEYVISKNLDITHPIGFSYDDAMAARGSKELVDKGQRFATNVTWSDTAGTYNTVTREGNRKISDMLYMGKIVTCCTCHDVHNTGNVKPDPGHNYNYLLWAKEEQSLICLSCHLK
jgi:hypothetical protein